MAEYDLQGKTVLVTGGANGIGAAMVRAFSAQGAVVAFCDKDTKAGRALAMELGPPAVFTRVDLAQERQIQSWIKRTAKTRKTIDVLVNNAAKDPRIPLRELTARRWDELFAGNLRACFLAAREAVPHMKPGSSIINFSSITFHIAPPEMAAYVATKGGVQGLTRSLARELGPKRIRVNTISPGWIMTERQLKDYVDASVKRLIRRSQCVPDLLRPEDIAEVALFLAGDASRAITGQEILADRGWAHS